MAGEESVDEKLAPREFVADFVWAVRAVFEQPSVALVSIAVWVLPLLLIRTSGEDPYSPGVALGAVLTFLFMLGWVGVERLFFLRRHEGKTVALRELLGSVPSFIGRFLRLGLLSGLMVTPLFLVAHYLERRFGAGATAKHLIEMVGIMVPLDLALTFVTSALVFTTPSVTEAFRIGLAMIRRTWPRSGLYLLCPPLALNMLNAIYPTQGLWVSVVTTAGLGLLALLAKGAIAAFYLREHPVASDAVDAQG